MKSSAISALALASSAAGSKLGLRQTNTTTTTTAPTATEPCAIVSSTWSAQIGATATPIVEASIAYECLNSVPIDKEGALKFIDELKPYIEWQSDTAFKKNPPADYGYPPTDLWASIDEVEEALNADKYANEYAWQADLYVKLFGPAHDGHFVVYMDALSAAVEWQRPYALVSISEEGPDGSAPVIKIYDDIVNGVENPSTVKLINGVDAATFIEDWINQAGGNQDLDAAYNSMFFEKAFLAENKNLGYFQTGGRVRYIYPGNSTSFTFENGTVLDLPNQARLKGNWRTVVDGPSFFAEFCPGASTSSSATTESKTTETASGAIDAEAAGVPVSGYPSPVIVSSDSSISGYFINQTGFEDVAVLAMLSFSPSDPVEFQQVAQDFYAAAVQAGKTKLVVDVQANGGGYIFLGYDGFRQLFPDIVQEGLGRWRQHEGFAAVSKVFSDVSADFNPDTASADVIEAYESVFNWRYDLNITDGNFVSYDDKFAPHTFLGDNFTNLMQWNFSDPLSTSNSTFGFGTDITGYGTRANFTRPFGGPENIVLLLDGYCASTCTLFSEFLRSNAGVKSIAMGGRPSKEGLIQGVGGVKGSQSYGFDDVYAQAQAALGFTNDTDVAATLNTYTEYVVDRSTAASLNVKDQILAGDVADGVPAQYVVEESDCRLWWTAPMVTDITELWKAAATAAFKGGKCAYGAIDYPTSNATTARRAASVPASVGKPRRTLPKTGTAAAPPTTKKRDAVQKSAAFMANQFMKAID
ncbi:uncharacterized protein F4807DRAFT_341782 [Annulohypoxylon truncatum]|uniref:uncharacterized protein n=1 Tax=Annulohypoxylon truncatum TaxID=327061 RepID=UPI0020085BE9|nr:uncharacterized protein F4807DRAFT_341782 [Annulohypoxylon truncatum]KAI1212581.1 hypothetical protein F4807DRAFT_341782 [Annulohypoxylon truncatum]